MRLVALLALAACGATSTPTSPEARRTEPTREAQAAAPPCLRFTSEVVALSPADGKTRHHPSVDVDAAGQTWVAWQIGKQDADVALARFDAAWTPIGAEVVVPDGGARATHPQLLADAGGAWLAWQHDDTGGVLLQRFGADGLPAHAAIPLHPDGQRPAGLYPDLAPRSDGTPVALWTADGAPRWPLATADGATAGELPVDPDATRGGPATLARHPDGTVYAAWGAQVVGWTRRSTRMYVAAVAPAAPATRVADEAARMERTTLAFGDSGAGVLAWTRYPANGLGWSGRVAFLDARGQPYRAPAVIGDGTGHMVDVAAAGDVALLGWQQLDAAGTDVRLQPWSLTSADPLCAPSVAHPSRDAAQARPSVWLRADPDGAVRGLVVWHAATAQPGVQRIAGRSFVLDLPRR